ncbi:hypothetical protein TSUD_01720 [Trifolium subterraneum]|nr:hypothetical protein TSUD_01720 [Trifolium subterraneum]
MSEAKHLLLLFGVSSQIVVLYMAPFSDSKRYHRNVGFWANVDGVDMSVLIPLMKDSSPSVETVDQECLLGEPHEVIKVDLYSITRAEIDFITTEFSFKPNRSAPLHGFAFWFVADFSEDAMFDVHYEDMVLAPVPLLSTAPDAPSTHWMQTLLDCPDPLHVEEDQVIEGILNIEIEEFDHRLLRISLKYGLDGELIELETQF